VAAIQLDGVTKAFAGGVVAVDDVTLEIGDGEFLVLVGPSGCGKSTLLRMIAGLEESTGGTISIGGADVTDLPPRSRDIAMVFQTYALYPHMSVRDNLAYGLKVRKTGKAETARRLNRLSLLLTLAAGLFFCGMTWALGRDGRLDLGDGLALIGLFLFWQCIQVFDVLKHNVAHKKSFGPLFWFDALVVLAAAYVMYVSIDWLVAWLSGLHGRFLGAQNLGWLSGWLMVLPNALFAVFYGVRRRTDIVYASQIGDGHICIPLCLGLAALFRPVMVTPVFATGLAVLTGAALLHLIFVGTTGGLPRWLGGALIATYGWFVYAGLLS